MIQADKTKFIFLMIGIIVSISLLVFVLISIPFFSHFKQHPISDYPQDWAAFGNYISGLTSVINLALFSILTIYVAKLGNTNSNKQIASQKKILRFKITLEKNYLCKLFCINEKQVYKTYAHFRA